jgi:hypothetical protein
MSKINEIIEETGLELSKSTAIQNAFGNFYSKIAEWKSELPSVTVTAYDQGDKILKARELRLEVRTARLEITKLHKELKADALKEGRAIDAVKNFALSELEPLEEAFKLNENYIAIQEELRLSKLREERMAIMTQYQDVLPVHQTAYELMSEEDFQAQVKMAKIAVRMKEEEEAEMQKAEEERHAKEEQERARIAEQQRIAMEQAQAEAKKAQEETEKLRKEAEQWEATRKAEREQEQARLEAIRKEGEERMKAIEAENQKRNEWNAQLSAKLKIAEESARENAEAKARILPNGIEIHDDEIHVENRYIQVHIHDNKTGPDKVRLRQFAQEFARIEAPACTTEDGIRIQKGINTLIIKIITYINEQTA